MRLKRPYMEAGMKLKLFQSPAGLGTYRHARDLTKSKSNACVEPSALLASITVQGIVQNLEAMCDRKRINTSPS